ncbi:MAG: hypothetical protein DRN92_05290 [Thermoproteota archaeon]|nr:MAG: hypothetical protein DRN92_05290 [Candidatus Korarchaeota archaeon]
MNEANPSRSEDFGEKLLALTTLRYSKLFSPFRSLNYDHTYVSPESIRSFAHSSLLFLEYLLYPH